MSWCLRQLVKVLISIDQSHENRTFRTLSQVVQTILGYLINQNAINVAKNIDNFIRIQCFSNDDSMVSQQEKNSLLEFIVCLVQKYPKLVKMDRERGTKIFKLALELVFYVSAQIKEQWINPPNESNIEQPDEDMTIKKIMAAIRALVIAIGFSNSQAIFKPIFRQFINQSKDWRYIYALLIVASQLAAKDADIEACSKIIQYAFSLTDDSHPKVRYAALLLIGQYIRDFGVQFILIYYDQVIFNTSTLLVDPIPRVVEQFLTCLGIFYTKYKEIDTRKRVVKQHKSLVSEYAITGSPRIKPKSFDTLCSIASLSLEIMSNEEYDTILQQIRLVKDGRTEMKVYQQLHEYGLTFQSIILSNRTQTQPPGIHNLAYGLLFYKDNIDKTAFFKCWTRLCSSYQSYADLKQIFPILFQEVKKFTSVHQQNCQGLICLKYIIYNLKQKASGFVDQIQAYCKQKIENLGRDQKELFKDLCQILTLIHTATFPEKQYIIPSWAKKVKPTYDYLISYIKSKLAVKDSQLYQFSYVYRAIWLLVRKLARWVPNQLIMDLAIQQFELLKGLKSLYDSLNPQLQGSEEYQFLESRPSEDVHFLSMAWALKDALRQTAQILKDIFYYAASPKKKILQLYQTQVQKYLSIPFFADFAQRTLFYILTIYPYPFREINEYHSFVNEMLQNFMKSSDARMRNAAVCGFKVIFTRLDPSWSLKSQQILKLLKFLLMQFNVISIKNSLDNEKQFDTRRCKDNVISALGCLLKYFGPIFPLILNQQVYKFWLNNLPLKTDITEGNEQQQFLIEILANSPGLIVNKAKDLLTIFQIYAKFVLKRVGKNFREILTKTKSSLLMIKQSSLFKQSQSYLQQNLNESHRKILKKLIGN